MLKIIYFYALTPNTIVSSSFLPHYHKFVPNTNHTEASIEDFNTRRISFSASSARKNIQKHYSNQAPSLVKLLFQITSIILYQELLKQCTYQIVYFSYEKQDNVLTLLQIKSMSIMKNSSKRKLHDEYLLSTKYLVTTQHTQTPKTRSKNHVRKISYISNPSNPSVRKLSITKTSSKRKSLQEKQHQRMKGKSKKEKQVEKDSQSQSKTKKNLSDNHRQKSSREKNDFSQNTCIGASRINSERGICLDAIYNRCSTVIASYEKKYLKLKKQNQRLKNENKRMKGNQ